MDGERRRVAGPEGIGGVWRLRFGRLLRVGVGGSGCLVGAGASRSGLGAWGCSCFFQAASAAWRVFWICSIRSAAVGRRGRRWGAPLRLLGRVEGSFRWFWFRRTVRGAGVSGWSRSFFQTASAARTVFWICSICSAANRRLSAARRFSESARSFFARSRLSLLDLMRRF